VSEAIARRRNYLLDSHKLCGINLQSQEYIVCDSANMPHSLLRVSQHNFDYKVWSFMLSASQINQVNPKNYLIFTVPGNRIQKSILKADRNSKIGIFWFQWLFLWQYPRCL